MTTVSSFPNLRVANALRAPSVLFTVSTISFDVRTDAGIPSIINCPVLTTISYDLRAGITRRGFQTPLELPGWMAAMLAHNLSPDLVGEFVRRAFRTAWAISTYITFVISWSVSGARVASLRLRCCFDAAVKTLPISSYIILYVSSTFLDDTKSTNLPFNSASPVAVSSSRFLPSCVFEGGGASVPMRADGRCRLVVILPRSRSIPSSCILLHRILAAR